MISMNTTTLRTVLYIPVVIVLLVFCSLFPVDAKNMDASTSKSGGIDMSVPVSPGR